jgi:membrane carboxypeptidase/penicillin-binding protein
MVWLSRTATVDALKRALAEREYFGRHAYGIKAARRAYYGCSASPLTTARVAPEAEAAKAAAENAESTVLPRAAACP